MLFYLRWVIIIIVEDEAVVFDSRGNMANDKQDIAHRNRQHYILNEVDSEVDSEMKCKINWSKTKVNPNNTRYHTRYHTTRLKWNVKQITLKCKTHLKTEPKQTQKSLNEMHFKYNQMQNT